MSDRGNRWKEVRWPRWEVKEDLKAKKSWMGWMKGIGERLVGREREKEGMYGYGMGGYEAERER